MVMHVTLTQRQELKSVDDKLDLEDSWRLAEIDESGYDGEDDTPIDEHIGCPSYPNCDEMPLGCIEVMGLDNVEWYGSKD